MNTQLQKLEEATDIITQRNYIHAGEYMECSHCGEEGLIYGDWVEDEESFHGEFICGACSSEFTI